MHLSGTPQVGARKHIRSLRNAFSSFWPSLPGNAAAMAKKRRYRGKDGGAKRGENDRKLVHVSALVSI